MARKLSLTIYKPILFWLGEALYGESDLWHGIIGVRMMAVNFRTVPAFSAFMTGSSVFEAGFVAPYRGS